MWACAKKESMFKFIEAQSCWYFESFFILDFGTVVDLMSYKIVYKVLPSL